MKKAALLIIYLILLFPACESAEEAARHSGEGEGEGTGEGEGEGESEGGFGTGEGEGEGESNGCNAMNILFVVDDSGSMAQEQTNLATNFPKFIEVLDSYDPGGGKNLEYRIGVTSTSVNRNYNEVFNMPGFPNMTQPGMKSASWANGKLVGQSPCSLSAPWIDGPGADVTQNFSCAANVGTSGSGSEMPFAAMENALELHMQAGGPNDGFYSSSENSLLVIIFITDEDDCSMHNGGKMHVTTSGTCNEAKSQDLYTTAETKDFLDDLAGEGRYVVVGIGGLQQCNSSAFGDAMEAKRLNRLIAECGQYGVQGDICQGDLSTALSDALETMEVACNEIPPPV